MTRRVASNRDAAFKFRSATAKSWETQKCSADW